MEDASVTPDNPEETASLPHPTQVGPTPGELRRRRQMVIVASLVGLVALVLLGGAIYTLTLPTTDTAKIRDIFIIIMALESLLIGLSLVILLVQLARLINLLQNEIKPILESTQNTVNTLQGTTAFLSDNMVEPVIKLNEYLAGLRSMLAFLRIARPK